MVRLFGEWDVPEWDGDWEDCFYDEWEGPSGTSRPEVQTGEGVGGWDGVRELWRCWRFGVVGERIVCL